MWCAALIAMNSFAWPTLDHYNIVVPGLYWLALALPLGALLLAGIGKFNQPRRVRTYVGVIGIFGVAPIAAALLLPLTALLMLEPTITGAMMLLAVAYILLSACWVIRDGYWLRRRIANSRFFEHETKEDAAYIYLNREPRICLDTDSADPGRVQQIGDWLVPKLIFLLPATYLVQRQVSQNGGTPAVLALAAALCTPLAMHVASEASRGLYLWIYQVGLIERKTGKQVLLSKS